MKNLTRFVKLRVWALLQRAQVTFQNNRVKLYLGKNPRLHKLLVAYGFFSFHSTNKGVVVTRSQVVAFFFKGGHEALKNGYSAQYGRVEVHHLNSLPYDDRPSNLRYVSTTDHKVCHDALNQIYEGARDSTEPTPFNSDGKQVKNHEAFLANLVEETLRKTSKACGMKLPRLNVREFLEALPARLWQDWVWEYRQELPTLKEIRLRLKEAKSQPAPIPILRFMRFIFFDPFEVA